MIPQTGWDICISNFSNYDLLGFMTTQDRNILLLVSYSGVISVTFISILASNSLQMVS